MSNLTVYYAFLVGHMILWAAFRNSTLISGKRSHYVGLALTPPIVLVVTSLNLSLLPTVLLLLALLSFERLIRRPERPVTPATSRLWLIVWLIEAVVPLSLHFALRAHPEMERAALVVAGSALLAGTLMTFVVVAPDLRTRA